MRSRGEASPGNPFLDPQGPLLVLGHRGFSAAAPENTLAAFRALIEHGLPGTELDVQLSRDGELMVLHDFSLKRTGGLEAEVRETDAATIRSLDAGSWFGRQFRGERIPSLDEVFEACGRRLIYDIELKWDRREANGLEQKVLASIRRHGLQDRCLLSSFNPFIVRRVQRLQPGLPTAHIYANDPGVPFLLRHGEASLAIPSPWAKPESSLIRPWRTAAYRLLLRSRRKLDLA